MTDLAPQKRFRVTGHDDFGDVHAFETDDQERAEDMRDLMREDLENVTTEDRG
jgi:hypothetical protein